MSNSHRKKILLIEDEKTLCFAFKKMLPTNRFIFLEANNGEEGLHIALQEFPDLIFLDLLMPVMDGETMLKLLRADSWGKDVPVIILSNLYPTDKTVLIDVATQHSLRYLIKSDLTILSILKEIDAVLATN